MPDLPGSRVHPMRFIAADVVNINDKGENCNHLVVTAELFETSDAKGKPFRVSKTYNLAGRGINAFSEDYAAWSRESLTNEQLDQFDTDALLIGKLAKVEIGHKKDGKDLVPVILKYLPAEAAGA